MATTNYRDAFARKEIRNIVLAGILFILAGLGYYFYLRHAILRGVERRSRETLQQTERLIRARMGRSETIVDAMQKMAEHILDDPDLMYEITEYIVQSSPQISGAGVAFIENYYPEKGKWYLPYVGHKKGCDSLIHIQLGGEKHDYLSMDWFQEGLASEDGSWSDPYFDPDGAQASMITYARAILDSTGRRVGVVAADITLDTLASLVAKVKLYPHSFCTLVTKSGETIVKAPANADKLGKCHTFTETIEGKNMIVTLTIPDKDMYSRLRKASLAFLALVLSGLFAVFFAAYRSVKNIWKLSEERIKNQHIEDELAIARKIQMSLMPSKTSSHVNTLNISGILKPAKYVGGDLYDYYVRDNKLFFCIGDISGKGVPAAMLMSIAHSLFRTLAAHIDQPENITQSINQSISDNNPDIMFITMFIGALDLGTGVVTYCNAGHNPPILIQSGRARYMDSADNLILGVDINADYTSRTLTLAPGDTLFLYTDGLTEAENPQKELFGEQNALDVAQKVSEQSADEQISAMVAAVNQFVGNAEQSDDLTMLAIRFLKGDHSLIMSNDIQELNKLEPFLNSFFEQENLPPSLIPQLNLAIEEAASNVIMYAYPEGEKGNVEVTLDASAGQIRTTLSDFGTPFDPLKQPEANLTDSIEDRPIGGLGIHLIKEIMSEVNYEHTAGKNVLTMTYDLNPKPLTNKPLTNKP